MPELPEVEITRRHLVPYLVGRRIENIQTTGDSYFFITPPSQLCQCLPGRRVEGLTRRGKYLLMGLSGGYQLLIHLGMTGQLFTSNATNGRLLTATARAALADGREQVFEPDAHTHLQLEFADKGPTIFFRDVRKFGKLLLLDRGQVHPRLARLGPDALEVSGSVLFRATRRRSCAIKTVLMNQSVIAGVGNIYADEALFLAGVRPGRGAAQVTRRQCDVLAQKLRAVLERSIKAGGSSISDFVAPDGSDGAYQNERHVYARANEPCHICQTPIKRSVVAQRSSHYCPCCQS